VHPYSLNLEGHVSATLAPRTRPVSCLAPNASSSCTRAVPRDPIVSDPVATSRRRRRTRRPVDARLENPRTVRRGLVSRILGVSDRYVGRSIWTISMDWLTCCMQYGDSGAEEPLTSVHVVANATPAGSAGMACVFLYFLSRVVVADRGMDGGRSAGRLSLLVLGRANW
jgi:hypothetical protein